MRRLISRTAALALSAAMALGAAAVPSAAGEPAASKTGAALTRLSDASRHVLAAPAVRQTRSTQAQAVPAATPGSFFKSTRGKVTLALMGAGTGFALWSVQHDRKPVKSPIR